MRRRDLLKTLGLLALPAGARAAAAPGADATRSARVTADRREDVRIAREALRLHPGVHRYLTPGEFESVLTRLEHEFVDCDDLDGQFLALSRALARLRCGHTYCNFYNQRAPVAAAVVDRQTRLPFEFTWLNGRMVVTRPLPGGDGLAPGMVVERVNGLDAGRLLSALMPYARADGHNDGKRRSLLSVRGMDRIEYFDVFQGLLFPPPARGHDLLVLDSAGRRRRIEVRALSPAERQAASRRPADDAPAWTWAMREDGVAVLVMPTWAMYSGGWKDWPGWLDDRFASLAGARGLVIDLRANEGGEDVGNEILARLASRDLVFEDTVQRLRFQRTPAALDPYLDTWDDSFRSLGVDATPLGDDWFERRPVEGATIVPRKLPRVTVRVAALVGSVNSSATHQFAERARRSGLVRLFGEETGGNRRGLNGGCFFFVRLPASGIEFDLPLVGTFSRTPQPDAGVIPDVVVRRRAEDVRNGRDPALDAAIAWARTG